MPTTDFTAIQDKAIILLNGYIAVYKAQYRKICSKVFMVADLNQQASLASTDTQIQLLFAALAHVKEATQAEQISAEFLKLPKEVNERFLTLVETAGESINEKSKLNMFDQVTSAAKEIPNTKKQENKQDGIELNQMKSPEKIQKEIERKRDRENKLLGAESRGKNKVVYALIPRETFNSQEDKKSGDKTDEDKKADEASDTILLYQVVSLKQNTLQSRVAICKYLNEHADVTFAGTLHGLIESGAVRKFGGLLVVATLVVDKASVMRSEIPFAGIKEDRVLDVNDFRGHICSSFSALGIGERLKQILNSTVNHYKILENYPARQVALSQPVIEILSNQWELEKKHGGNRVCVALWGGAIKLIVALYRETSHLDPSCRLQTQLLFALPELVPYVAKGLYCSTDDFMKTYVTDKDNNKKLTQALVEKGILKAETALTSRPSNESCLVM